MFYNKFTKKDPVAEEIEKIISERWDDDDEDDDVKKADAELRRMKAKPIEADKKTDPDKEIGKLAKKTPKEVDEEVVVEGSGPKEKQRTPYMPFAQRSKEGREIMKQHKAEHEQEKKAKEAAKIGMKKEEVEQIDELSVGKLDAYRKKASVDADRLDKIDTRKTQNKLGSVSPEGHKAINRRLGGELADTKIKKKTGTYHPSMLDKVKSKLRKEDAEQIDELSKDTLGSYVKKSSDAADKHLKLANSAAQRSKTKADTAQYMKHSEKFGKRIGGMVTAKKKLKSEEVDLSEKHLTPAESKKKEEIAKALKSKYGKSSKTYAIATAQAKKVAEDVELGSRKHTAVYHGGSEEIAKHLFKKHSGTDISDKDINQDYKQSKQPLANRIMLRPDHKEIHSEYKRLQKPKNEDVEQIDESYKVGPENKSDDGTVWHSVTHKGNHVGTIGTNHPQHQEIHGKWGFEDQAGNTRKRSDPKLNSKKSALSALITRHKSLTNEDVELNESHYADMSHAAKELVLHADNDQHLYHSSHVPIMNNLRKKMKKGEYHPEKAKKLWAYHADRAAQSYAKHHGDGTPWHKMFSTADRKAAASHFEDMHRHELNEAKGPGADYGLETFATNPTNEAPVTPLERAKDLARSAMAKIKNEMLGKAGATSEEIDPRIRTSDTLKGRVKTNRSDDVGPSSVARSSKVKYTPGPK